MTDSLDDPRELLGQFVARTPSITARLVRSQSTFTEATSWAHLNESAEPADGAHVNELGRARDQPARGALAAMLQSERVSAFHDALVILQEALALGGFSLHQDGLPIADDPHGLTLFQEYVAILQDKTERPRV